MKIDQYNIGIGVNLINNIFEITLFTPRGLDDGIFDQLKANEFEYVNDNLFSL